MISYTDLYLHQNTAELQKLAEHIPVLISDNGRKQVLMSYESYQQLAGTEADKPFDGSVEFLQDMLSELTDEQQELIASSDIEFDMSFVSKS